MYVPPNVVQLVREGLLIETISFRDSAVTLSRADLGSWKLKT